METYRVLPAQVHPGEETAAASAWRVRIRVDDRPGTLARIAIRLADLECNILGLSVLPVPGGVLDEIVLRPATGLPRQLLVDAIRDEGCECSAVIDADLAELVDPATATLAAAKRAVEEPGGLAEVLRGVLAADVVTKVPSIEANPARTEGGHRAVFPAGDGGTAFVARRRWSPFVELELSRAVALTGLMSAVRDNVTGPIVLDRPDGAAIVLRKGVPGDAEAVSALHQRCSMTTLFHRYHTGMRAVPRRWLHRLLMPPRGSSLLAVCGRDVIGLGQLIPSANGGAAEVSLLVEDSWQRQGIGTALLSRLAVLAEAGGERELAAVCLPGDDSLYRTAARIGLRPERTPGDSGTLRFRLPGPRV
ncbi:GNAT family N-acetyltransferase [Amycolatopsis umgeniensis]|uniref:GNAT superfamily N-acetyltransferase n=1 Tax=Amycolatopsis umgeniensis TaxID=336628 RepID=A0A841B9E1_9PSEU|nr:GNAT family N-acetyltransferase [Amycolatopsis umgeniensis]MBB5856646.1 GNAT superfamily N-acetyltransferase [Amycolatopsis umgeniensis]